MENANDDCIYQVRGMGFRLLKVKAPWAVLGSLDGREQILTDMSNLLVYRKSAEKEPDSGRYDF